MNAKRRRCLIGLACLGTALTVGAEPLAACDPVWLPIVRPDGISVFVALALGETVLDTLGGSVAARTHALFGSRLDSYTPASRGGQRVRLLDPDDRPPREAVLVPWAYRSDCRPIGWTERLDWIPAGTRGAVTGWLRPREHWLAGLPTYDVEMAWREPVWTQDEPRWTVIGSEETPRMTPEEFVQLYTALPTVAELEGDAREAIAGLRRWEEAHSTLAGREPAPTMLANAYRAATARLRPSIAGRWLIEVELVESSELPLPVRSRRIAGELDLRAVPLTPDAEPGAPTSVHTGTSTLDFSPLGFRLGSAEVLAMVEESGVRIILDPNVDHGHVAATLEGGADELAGTWYLNSRPARASGRIELKRRRQAPG